MSEHSAKPRKMVTMALLLVMVFSFFMIKPMDILAEPSSVMNIMDYDQPSPWAAEDVEWAIALGLVPYHLQSNYTQPITRAEFAELAVTFYEFMFGEVQGRSTFADTNDVSVQKAAYLGIVSGVGNNMFAPDNQLTREQAAAMLSRLSYAIGFPLTTSPPTFSDNQTISSWAFDVVGEVQGAGIMSGVGNNMFAPLGVYTREQSIITIVRVLDMVFEQIFFEFE